MKDRLILENEFKVTTIISKGLLFFSIVFPIMCALSFFNIISIGFFASIVIMIIGEIFSLLPIFINKMVKHEVAKNFNIFSVVVITSLLASTTSFGIGIAYIIPLVLSCLYMDKKFTKRTCSFGYFACLISVFFMAEFEAPIENKTVIQWFIPHIIVITVEHIVVSEVCVAIVDRIKKIIDMLPENEISNDVIEDFVND